MIRRKIFEEIINERGDTPELVNCMKETVSKLHENETSSNKPGILLGKIQSGKTRAFIGIMALAFDSGYDVSIILTKGTKALVKQTVQRRENDFNTYIEDDIVEVFDIMHMPDTLTAYIRNKKLIIVVKKEVNNMKRILGKLGSVYPDLQQKKILIIDDEADFASISFRKRAEAIEIGKISSQVDELRNIVKEIDYLQVTATPYSLYLQSTFDEKDIEFLPKRPAFTVVVPIHEKYIGGKFYFEDSEDKKSIAYDVYQEVSTEERDVLKKQDLRRLKLEDVLVSDKIPSLRSAVMNFIVGTTIRRLQQGSDGQRMKKYAFVAHSEISRASHKWQAEVINTLVSGFIKAARDENKIIVDLIGESYKNILQSIKKQSDVEPPSLDEVKTDLLESLAEEHVMVTIVNSDNDVEELLDKEGQLKLRNPMNIFIGGQILDRGVTINNLIGFYYGRSPKRFQQDTVLQHSRMYGARPYEDLAVTRFYTTRDIYETMKRINEFDSALREAFECGGHKKGVYFIRKDVTGKLVPCSPNKLLLSSLSTLRPYRRILPVGFKTGYKTNIRDHVDEIDRKVHNWFLGGDEEEIILVDLEKVIEVVNLIEKTLELNKQYPWSWNTFVSSLEHLSNNNRNETNKGKIKIIVREDRNTNRKREFRFSNVPITETDSSLAKASAINTPCLLLIRQNGLKENGWRGTPFWWPVLVNPANTEATIFAEDLV